LTHAKSPKYVETTSRKISVNDHERDELFSYERVESSRNATQRGQQTTMQTTDFKPRAQMPVPQSHPYISMEPSITPEKAF